MTDRKLLFFRKITLEAVSGVVRFGGEEPEKDLRVSAVVGQ